MLVHRESNLLAHTSQLDHLNTRHDAAALPCQRAVMEVFKCLPIHDREGLLGTSQNMLQPGRG